MFLEGAKEFSEDHERTLGTEKYIVNFLILSLNSDISYSKFILQFLKIRVFLGKMACMFYGDFITRVLTFD